MQVHRQNAVRTHRSYKVRHHLGGDWDAGLDLSVLTGISIIRNDCRYPRGRGPFKGIDYQQKLHDVVIDRRAGRLYDKRIRPPDILVQPDHNLSVAEAANSSVPKTDAKIHRNLARKFSMGRSCKKP